MDVMLTALQTRDYGSVMDIVTSLQSIYSKIMLQECTLETKGSAKWFFNDNLNRHLFTFGPPRTEKHFTIKDTGILLNKLHCDIKRIFSISMDVSFDSLMVYLNQLTSVSTQLNVLSRSILLVIYYQ